MTGRQETRSWVPVLVATSLLTANCCAGRRPTETPDDRPQRIALLVGIDDYSASKWVGRRSGPASLGKGGRSAWPNLRGAVNDVADMWQTLTGPFGFEAENVHKLTDQSATREAILDGIERRLVKQAGPGVWTVFYYSGHGSQVVNSKSRERDGLDETLVPADSRLGVRDIRDKELRRLFNRILDRGARLTVILDACHSASGARGLPVEALPRGLEPDRRDVIDGADVGPRPEDRGALILSASQDFELAWETWDEEEEEHQGAFTLALLESLRIAGDGESAERIFLRSRAKLQRARNFQHPVLAGNSEARRSALFGGRTDHRAGRIVVAVQSVDADGTIQLQGGWANGLNLGSRLKLLGSEDGQAPILEIVEMLGLSRSKAKTVDETDQSSNLIEAGSLFEMVGWTAPPGPPLRVFVSRVKDRESVGLKLAKDLFNLAQRGEFKWVEDPMKATPTHILRQRQDHWQLTGPKTHNLGPDVTADAVLKKLQPGPAKLFVQLPVPSQLASRIRIGADFDRNAVQPASDPAEAYYLLVGRLHQERLEYAWLRPGVSLSDGALSGLPSRTDWYPWLPAGATEDEENSIALKLEDAVFRLAKIRAWHSLESLPQSEFPYRLAIRKDERLVEEGPLRENQEYGLAMTLRETDPPLHVAPRYVYVFVIDGFGKSVLLFPTTGAENRFPPQADKPPAQILLDEYPLFRVSEPLGVDAYFLLTSAEPLPNPWVLEYEGVRTRGPQGSNALEELLSQTGGARVAQRLWTPIDWSIQKRLLVSVPADY